MLSEPGDQIPMKMSDPGDPAFLNASVIVSSEFCIQIKLKAASWDGLVSQTILARTSDKSLLSHYTENGQQML